MTANGSSSTPARLPFGYVRCAECDQPIHIDIACPWEVGIGLKKRTFYFHPACNPQRET